ncbi:MAG: hypothetical protein K9G61_05895 [Bacteroidales bacterium]|nr:hypothetical protein [Bacteroidales bacterium]
MNNSVISYFFFYLKNARLLLLSGLGCLFISTTYAQTVSSEQNENDYYKTAELQHKYSDLLINGPLYYQPRPLAATSPFLITSGFKNGTIFIGGLSFENRQVNYDLVTQCLVLELTMENGARYTIQLSEALVDSFSIDRRLFVNTRHLANNLTIPYAEAINGGKTRMILTYKKEFIKQFNNNTPNGKFSSDNRAIYLASNNTATRIRSKKSFLRSLCEYRKPVGDYLRKNKIRFMKASPDQFKIIMGIANSSKGKMNE